MAKISAVSREIHHLFETLMLLHLLIYMEKYEMVYHN